MWKATKGIKKIQQENGYNGIVETFKKTTNVTTLTAFTEDFVALLGIVMAFAGIVLTRYLGNPLYDAATSLVIGVLLMGVAVALAWENKRLILGESMEPSKEDEIRTAIIEFEEIESVHDLRTLYFGPDTVLVTVRADIVDDVTSSGVEELSETIRKRIKDLDPDIQTVYLEANNSNEKH